MARTSYKSYKWLIETLEGAPSDGYTLKKIQDLYASERGKLERHNVMKGRANDEGLKGVSVLKRTTFINWRSQIWVQFGLIIETPKYDNYYVLTNREELDNNKTLREIIEHLVNDEEREKQRHLILPPKKSGRKPQNTTTLGLMMSFSNGCNVCEDCPIFDSDNEMVDNIRFSMMLGESIPVIYSKKKLTLEPQQLKFINGRWYVIGNTYTYDDNKEKTDYQLCVYDVGRLKIDDDDDEITPTHYKVIEDFNFENYLPNDWKKYNHPR